MSADDERWQPGWSPGLVQQEKKRRTKKNPAINSFTQKPRQSEPIKSRVRIRIPRVPKDFPGVLSPRHRFYTAGQQGRKEIASKWFGIVSDDADELVRLVKAKFDELGYCNPADERMRRYRDEKRRRTERWHP